MSKQYSITFDIFWTLSFNQDIQQQQLLSNGTFMSRLIHRPKEYDNEQMRKISHGILWNQLIEIEQYRRSNSCRAEAHCAFQRQLKIMPILLQGHYQPDWWLWFLIGQLLYVDFNKYEFSRAMEKLIEELRSPVAPIHLNKMQVLSSYYYRN